MNRTALESFANSKKSSSEYRQEDEIVLTENYPENQKTTQKNYPENQKTTQKKIGKTAQSIIDALVADPHLTRAGLAGLVGKTEDTVKIHLSNLQSRGIIQRVGPDKGGYWKVVILNFRK